MRRLWVGLILAAWAVQVARGEWAIVPIEKLVLESDAVVLGRLGEVEEGTDREAEMDYGRGVVKVERSLWGPFHVGERLELRWRNGSRVGCPRVEHRDRVGRLGFWLLTFPRCGRAPDASWKSGVVACVGADYPGRFVPAAGEEEVTRALGVVAFVRRSAEIGGGEARSVEFVQRNATGQVRAVPGLRIDGGRVRVDESMRLTVREEKEDGHGAVAPVRGAIIASRGICRRLEPNAESVVAISVDRLFRTDPSRACEVELVASGRTSRAWVCARPAQVGDRGACRLSELLRAAARQGKLELSIGKGFEDVVTIAPDLSTPGGLDARTKLRVLAGLYGVRLVESGDGRLVVTRGPDATSETQYWARRGESSLTRRRNGQ